MVILKLVNTYGETNMVNSVMVKQCKGRHVRWSCGYQVRQVGFLRALRFPPTRRPSEHKHEQI